MAKRVYDVQVVCHEKNLVGEGPAWNEEEQALYWVDIHAPAIRRLSFEPSGPSRCRGQSDRLYSGKAAG